jgi:hypothetical protein
MLAAASACTSTAPAVTVPAGNPTAPASAAQPAPSAATAKPSPSQMVPRITVDELYKKIQSGAKLLVIDGRAGVETEYIDGHIKGAKAVTLSEFTAGWDPKVPPDTEIVIYCT